MTPSTTTPNLEESELPNDMFYKTKSWDELKAYIDADRLDLLKRTPEAQCVYENASSNFKNSYGSVSSYLLDHVLKFPPTPFTYVIRRNDFPYNIDASVDHYLIWAPRIIEPEEVEQILEKELPNTERMWFKNPVNLQSVPGIMHIHVFSRMKEKIDGSTTTEQFLN